MIIRVVEQCLKSELNKVVVATDDNRIATVVEQNGYDCVLTPNNLQSGTERCFYAFKLLSGSFDNLVNIQGDEPFISPGQINQIIKVLNQPKAEIATLYASFKNEEEIQSPHSVKLVCNTLNKALYFSRSIIPGNQKSIELSNYKKHVGIYGFKTKMIETIEKLKPSMLESSENLEQLRWLEAGLQISVDACADAVNIAIDTPEDLIAANNFLNNQQNSLN